MSTASGRRKVPFDPAIILAKAAPHGTRTSQVDEVAAARKPVLRWKPA
jgi:hypothetical protein